MFVKLLIETGGVQVAGKDADDLFHEIENLYELEPDQRRLGTLAKLLNQRLAQPLAKWVGVGQYGTVFDNLNDNLTFARFLTVDFTDIKNYPQVIEPLLFYILHRVSAVVWDHKLRPTLKLFLADEAWRFLQHPVTKDYIDMAFRTWRKYNAAIILATQSGGDVLRSETLSIILESGPTKLFLANPGMDIAAYQEVFHLNQTQAELISRLTPKRQFLLVRPDMAKVLNLNVDHQSHSLYTNQRAVSESSNIASASDTAPEQIKKHEKEL